MAANQLKYPNNEFASHIVSVDVLSRSVDSETGILKTQKIIGLQQKLPTFVNKILGLPKILYFLESSETDSKGKRFRSFSTNVNLRNIAILREICEYRPNKSNPTFQTHYRHTATVSMAPKFNNFSMIEDVALNVFKSNSHSGSKLLESVLQIIETEKPPSVQSTSSQ